MPDQCFDRATRSQPIIQMKARGDYPGHGVGAKLARTPCARSNYVQAEQLLDVLDNETATDRGTPSTARRS